MRWNILLDENKLLSDRQRIISALTAARIEKGLSQQALADMIGTKKSTISRMENHAEDVRFSTIQKIAAACGKKVSIAFI
ncbi:MAG: helix-turn-helix transcriptional regulator [Spirochaetales bacterium]|nr:helix-turn-helix transcriptional regulator [Spirochaetales bacterium]